MQSRELFSSMGLEKHQLSLQMGRQRGRTAWAHSARGASRYTAQHIFVTDAAPCSEMTAHLFISRCTSLVRSSVAADHLICSSKLGARGCYRCCGYANCLGAGITPRRTHRPQRCNGKLSIVQLLPATDRLECLHHRGLRESRCISLYISLYIICYISLYIICYIGSLHCTREHVDVRNCLPCPAHAAQRRRVISGASPDFASCGSGGGLCSRRAQFGEVA
mmetsp:Transcript_12636/g.21193  ORF Transcript_12636/g.21193 Transcript_12636/m.21193 type:complete len:221 (-) Transcript_12636:472-1134(-)